MSTSWYLPETRKIQRITHQLLVKKMKRQKSCLYFARGLRGFLFKLGCPSRTGNYSMRGRKGHICAEVTGENSGGERRSGVKEKKKTVVFAEPWICKD